MSILSMVEAKLPPGFRFHPRDDELVCDYLSHRATATAAATTTIDGAGLHGFPAMVDVDLNKCEPWDLPEVACIRGKEWYFFSLKDKKYATGQRTNRATRSGYWKATGKDRHVLRKGALVGKKKTLVFYQGRAPKGKKTQWVMHEFRMECSSLFPKSSFKEDRVLCRVFYKCRSLSSKITMETCDEDAGSSSLPPLMDSQITSYEQASHSHEELEQVPCFSSFSASQAAANVSSSSSSLNTFSYDKKVLKVVVSKLEENQQINGGSCFTDSGILIPSLWNPFGGF